MDWRLPDMPSACYHLTRKSNHSNVQKELGSLLSSQSGNEGRNTSMAGQTRRVTRPQFRFSRSLQQKIFAQRGVAQQALHVSILSSHLRCTPQIFHDPILIVHAAALSSSHPSASPPSRRTSSYDLPNSAFSPISSRW